MIISILIIGTILILSSTFIITVIVSKIDNTISKLSEDIENFHVKTSLFTQLTSKQLTENVMEELCAFQTNFYEHIREDDLAKIFSENVLKHCSRSAGQWASASMSNNLQDLEDRTKIRIDAIIADNTMSMLEKRRQIEGIGNENTIIATKKFNIYKRKIQLKRKEIFQKSKRRRLWYNIFVWLQILGLITLAFGNVLEKLNK